MTDQGDTRRVVEGFVWRKVSNRCWQTGEGDDADFVTMPHDGIWRYIVETDTPEAAMLAYARSRKTGAEP